MIRRAFFLTLSLLPGFLAAQEAAAAKPFRILTYNIHHGEGMDKKLDLARVAAFIKKVDADAVFLQEVDNKTKRTGGVDQAAELGKLAGLEVTFGKAMDFQGGGYGNAILTKAKPAGSRVIPLPGGGEPRAALVVEIADGHGISGDGKITLVCTHLDVSAPKARETHAKQLADEFAKTPGTVICGGDMNCGPQDAPMKAFTAPWLVPKKQGDKILTCPCPVPRNEIDFLMVKPSAGKELTVPRYEVLQELVISDHLPVVMEIRKK